MRSIPHDRRHLSPGRLSNRPPHFQPGRLPATCVAASTCTPCECVRACVQRLCGVCRCGWADQHFPVKCWIKGKLGGRVVGDGGGHTSTSALPVSCVCHFSFVLEKHSLFFLMRACQSKVAWWFYFSLFFFALWKKSKWQNFISVKNDTLSTYYFWKCVFSIFQIVACFLLITSNETHELLATNFTEMIRSEVNTRASESHLSHWFLYQKQISRGSCDLTRTWWKTARRVPGRAGVRHQGPEILAASGTFARTWPQSSWLKNRF